MLKITNILNNNALFTVTGACIGIIAIIILFAYLKHKNVNAKDALEKIKEFFTSTEEYTEAAENLTTGKIQKVLQSAEAFEKLAVQGADYAEQMLLSLQITDDIDGTKRKEAATNYVYAVLKSNGIKITDNIKIIVSGIIEKTIFSDKAIDEINSKIDKCISEKVTSLQNQVATLTKNNTELQNKYTIAQQKIAEFTQKLNTIQSAATEK